MNESNETFSELLDPPASEGQSAAEPAEESSQKPCPTPIPPLPPTGYRNRTARLLNCVYLALLGIGIVFLLFQLFFLLRNGLESGFLIALVYTLPSLLTSLLLFITAPFLFKFFAELIELLERKS